ncbi:general odorant-binding protein 71 [Nylanderia fulva]|uniref:general odorant-binding protein 71 n=1 Tax=Nylanderia fulva TaxID=613905 RepID=UPI0010FBA119|nr:general odorant-binding protein 71 [Nylanderia fulva]
MVKVILIVLCSVCFFLVKSAISLKCKTDAQQTNQFKKIVQVCKKRITDDNNYNYDESSLSEEDDNDESSDINTFDTKFFLIGSNKFYNTHSWENSNDNRNQWNDQKNGNDQRYSFNRTNKNRKNAHDSNHNGNNHDFNYSDGITKSSWHDQTYNTNSENNKEQEQACLVQCFFNELNIVDQRGFPKQDSILQLITHNLHNSEIQDFVVEAVIECFHYLGLDMREDKCYYSQNLLTCLNEKRKESCEDWRN